MFNVRLGKMLSALGDSARPHTEEPPTQLNQPPKSLSVFKGNFKIELFRRAFIITLQSLWFSFYCFSVGLSSVTFVNFTYIIIFTFYVYRILVKRN